MTENVCGLTNTTVTGNGAYTVTMAVIPNSSTTTQESDGNNLNNAVSTSLILALHVYCSAEGTAYETKLDAVAVESITRESALPKSFHTFCRMVYEALGGTSTSLRIDVRTLSDLTRQALDAECSNPAVSAAGEQAPKTQPCVATSYMQQRCAVLYYSVEFTDAEYYIPLQLKKTVPLTVSSTSQVQPILMKTPTQSMASVLPSAPPAKMTGSHPSLSSTGPDVPYTVLLEQHNKLRMEYDALRKASEEKMRSLERECKRLLLFQKQKMADGEALESLRSEVDRLRAENELLRLKTTAKATSEKKLSPRATPPKIRTDTPPRRTTAYVSAHGSTTAHRSGVPRPTVSRSHSRESNRSVSDVSSVTTASNCTASYSDAAVTSRRRATPTEEYRHRTSPRYHPRGNVGETPPTAKASHRRTSAERLQTTPRRVSPDVVFHTVPPQAYAPSYSPTPFVMDGAAYPMYAMPNPHHPSSNAMHHPQPYYYVAAEAYSESTGLRKPSPGVPTCHKRRSTSPLPPFR